MTRAQSRIYVCLSIAVCVVLSSARAAADEGTLGPERNSLSIGVTAGIFLPDSDAHDFYYTTNTWQPLDQIGPVMGLRFSYEPLRYLGLEVEGEAIQMRTDAMDDSATVLGWRAQVVGQLPGRLTPFALLGAGSMGIISADDVLGDDNDLIQHLGAGAKFFITPGMSIRLDGRWLIAPKVDAANADDDTVSHFLVTTSLSWRFNGGPPAPPLRLDTDEDGVIGEADKCPSEAGEAPDGCPVVADRDGDGVLDPADRCPEEREVIDGVDDEDGCPDKALDQDSDGVADREDKCPGEAEDMDSFQDTDGCPDKDNDGDGLADADDACALAAGPSDNRGCPDKDGDADGLADRLDNCPAEAGPSHYHGCKQKQLVVLGHTDIKVLDSVYFANGKSAIRARSNALLDNLARVLNAHPEITRIYVDGHTDDKGEASYNKDLSQRRAQSVVDYIAGRGVSASRIEAVGRGEEAPIADNGTARGRSQNRRVEFRIERSPSAAP
jgi:outer membrane protein OmpA-like peptidoglycan-associated protein